MSILKWMIFLKSQTLSKGKKSEENRKKALEVGQQSLETFSQTTKRRNEKGETAPTKSKKNDILKNLLEKNGRESGLKEKELKLKEKEVAARKQEANKATA